jgi:hypothetical protein
MHGELAITKLTKLGGKNNIQKRDNRDRQKYIHSCKLFFSVSSELRTLDYILLGNKTNKGEMRNVKKIQGLHYTTMN